VPRGSLKLTRIALPVACGLAALFLPTDAGWVGGVRTAVSATFVPVSHPARAAAGGLDGLLTALPVDAESVDTPREAEAVYAENQQLRQQAARLLLQLETLKRIVRDRAKLGTGLRDRVEPAAVTGSALDTGLFLQLAPASPGAPGQRVLHTAGETAGVVGTVADATPAGVRVRMLTDPAHRPVDGRFARLDPDTATYVIVPTEPFVVSGAGLGRCVISRHPEADLTENAVGPGDLVVLSDPAWPEVMHGVALARVASIEPLAQAPGFARVELIPTTDLASLAEVMVLSRP
jgi:hypothetical protein